MMGYTAPSKAAIARAIKAYALGDLPELRGSVLDFWDHVQETSFFGPESKVPGENTVVGPDAYTDRRWYATLTVSPDGIVTAIR